MSINYTQITRRCVVTWNVPFLVKYLSRVFDTECQCCVLELVVAVWLSYNEAEHFNEITLYRSRLVLGWVNTFKGTDAGQHAFEHLQMDHMQSICTSLQTDNHASTSSLSVLQARRFSWCPVNSVKALFKSTGLTCTKYAIMWACLIMTEVDGRCWCVIVRHATASSSCFSASRLSETITCGTGALLSLPLCSAFSCVFLVGPSLIILYTFAAFVAIINCY